MAATTQRIYELQVKVAQESLNQLKQLKQSAQNTEKSLDALTGVAKSFGAGLLAGFSVDAFISGLSQAVSYVDELATQAQRLGVSVESFSRLEYAAEQSDVSIGELTIGMKELQKTMAAMGTTDKGANILEALGIVTDGKSPEEVLAEFADGLQTIQDPVTQTNALIEVLGRSGLALRPMLEDGSEGLKAFATEAENLGRVVNDETATKLGDLDNMVKKLQGTTRSIFIDIAEGLTPSLERMGNELLNASVDGETFKNVGESLGVVLTGLANAAAIVAKGFEIAGGNIGAVAAAFAQVVQGNFSEAFDILKMRTADVGAEFAALGDTLTDLSVKAPPVASAAKEIADAEKAVADNSAAVTAVLKKSTEAQNENTKAKKASKIATDEMLPGEKERLAILKEGADLTLQMRTAQEVMADEFERYNELLARGAITQETYNRAVRDAAGNYQTSTEAVTKTKTELEGTDALLDSLGDKIDGYGKDIAGTLIDWSTGAEDVSSSFGDMVDSILRDILQMVTQIMIVEPLIRSLKTAMAGAGGAGGFLSLFAADGAVLDHGHHVKAYAKGGVVNSPTLFPMANGAGLMGEAGPEAIMPLTRGADGKLGVQSSGGGGSSVEVNVYNQSESKVSVQEDRGPNGEQMINIMVEKAVENAISSGRLDSTLSTVYGLNRRGR
jgi:hypothetical protein